MATKQYGKVIRDFAAGMIEPLPTQQSVDTVRKGMPLSVIRKLMIKETWEAPTHTPRGYCIRCRTTFLYKYLIDIEQPWPKEPAAVCRLCYNSKSDIRARDAIKPRQHAKHSCA
jgi:hypothetical protein